MRIELTDKTIAPWRWIAQREAALLEAGKLSPNGYGATASFVGTMRNFNDGSDVEAMELIHYPGMTEKELELIVDECLSQHETLEAAVIHRTGLIQPSDTLVIVVVWSAHRKAAFEACRAIMEALKTRAPFWKKELTRDGERWVAKNTAG